MPEKVGVEKNKHNIFFFFSLKRDAKIVRHRYLENVIIPHTPKHELSMKPVTNLLTLIAVTLISCNTAGRLRKECSKGRDMSSPAVVITKSGEVFKGNKLIETEKEHVLDGRKIPNDDVVASQSSNNSYYVRQGDRWHRRVRNGKINFYYATRDYAKINTTSGIRTNERAYDFFLQKGTAQLESFSVKRLREMVSDNQQATDYMKKLYPGIGKEYYNTSYLKMLKVIDYYNSN
jgi:hypothetical protein